MRFRSFFLSFMLLFMGQTISKAAELRLAVTSSFQNSGLADVLLPKIKEDLGLEIHLLVVGTGQALELGKSKDVDAILVHSKAVEQKFVAEGYATHRREIMYNDFVIVGPRDDPAKVKTATSVTDALSRVFATKKPFVSRGDDSGTHKRELRLWQTANLNSEDFETHWYTQVGAGMGAALNIASALNAYIITDRGSWLNFSNKKNLTLLFEGSDVLFNQYAFLPIKSERRSKEDLVKKLELWFTSERAHSLISNYRIQGQTVFIPNARSQ